jgi:hypothetical protein
LFSVLSILSGMLMYFMILSVNRVLV